ncbi:MAG: hypothetical protein LIO96_12695, partial [Lachnospiraceae bacterium]|nr:hypothetical protein [Lachnospiraceae bacterium]
SPQSPQLIFIDSDCQNKDIHHLLLDLQMSGFQGWENNIVLLIERDSQSVEQLRQTLAVGIQKVLFYPFAYEECSSLFLRPGEPEEKQMETKQTELYLARSLRSLRNAFINRFLESDFFLDLDLQTLNTQYHMNLSEGLFRFVIIKFPVLASESEKMQHRMMQDDLVHNIRQVFDPICLEIVPFIRDSNTIFLILNYSSSRKLEKHFHRLAGLTEETARQYYDARLPYTVGIGNAVSNIRELHYAFQTAQYALHCQLLYGFNQTYLYGAQRFTPPGPVKRNMKNGFLKSMASQNSWTNRVYSTI